MQKIRLKDIAMLSVFILGLIFFILGGIPPMLVLTKIWPKGPNGLISGIIVISSTVLPAAVSMFIGFFLGMLLWKPFLNLRQAYEAFFEPVPETNVPKDARKFLNSISKFYLKIAFIIYPKIKKEFSKF